MVWDSDPSNSPVVPLASALELFFTLFCVYCYWFTAFTALARPLRSPSFSHPHFFRLHDDGDELDYCRPVPFIFRHLFNDVVQMVSSIASLLSFHSGHSNSVCSAVSGPLPRPGSASSSKPPSSRFLPRLSLCRDILLYLSFRQLLPVLGYVIARVTSLSHFFWAFWTAYGPRIKYAV